MYKLENKIETTIIIKFNNTGAVNVHTNAFISHRHIFEYFFRDVHIV